LDVHLKAIEAHPGATEVQHGVTAAHPGSV
jgi:hypothetical protein